MRRATFVRPRSRSILLQLRTITCVDALGEHVASDAASGARGRLQGPPHRRRTARGSLPAERRAARSRGRHRSGTGHQGQLPVHPLHIHRPPTISARARWAMPAVARERHGPRCRIHGASTVRPAESRVGRAIAASGWSAGCRPARCDKLVISGDGDRVGCSNGAVGPRYALGGGAHDVTPREV
jgi:hypothetical protein